MRLERERVIRSITEQPTKSLRRDHMGHAAEFTDGGFDADVLKSSEPVLVDFWATWCGPCRQIAPLIDELALKYQGTVKIGKVNVDENPDLSAKYGINAIPTLLLFKDGEVVEKFQGVPPRARLEAALDSVAE
jgi:thioredoxin 1